ncbi:MAG: redoxin domain-containing protein [Planctomycetaceae bacterium]|nr:redoxin domain-containing protein [Planctomycetaceae bacterium]
MRLVQPLLFCTVIVWGTSILQADEIKLGDKAPDFEVTNMDGKTVKLSDWVGKKKLVVVFSRAHWCPFCMGQLKDLSKHYDDITKAGGEVIVVFREERDGVKGLKKSQQAASSEFPLLLDLGAKATPEYSTTGFTTYIIGKDGTVETILSGKKTNRPKAEAIIAALND